MSWGAEDYNVSGPRQNQNMAKVKKLILTMFSSYSAKNSFNDDAQNNGFSNFEATHSEAK